MHINTVLAAYPMGSLLGYTAGSMASMGVLWGAVSLSGVGVSANFAVAFVCGQITRQLSMPLTVSLAVPLARLAPVLSQVNASALLGATARDPQLQAKAPWLAKALGWLEGPIDKYGAALLVSRRLVGLSKFAVFYTLLSRGIDVQAYLASWGLPLETGETVGPMMAAVMLNTALLPLHVAVAVAAAPALTHAYHRVSAQSRLSQ